MVDIIVKTFSYSVPKNIAINLSCELNKEFSCCELQ